MPPQQPPTLDPLGAISPPQPAPSTAVVDALRLAGVNQAAQTGRNTATNRANLTKAGMPLGLNPYGGNYDANLDIRRRQQGALANAQALGAAASGGVRLPKGGLTDPGFDLSGVLPNVQSGYMLKGASQAANMPRPKAEVADTKKITKNTFDRAQGGGVTIGKEETTKKVVGKDTDRARQAAGITTPGVNLIPKAKFEAGAKLGAGKSPRDVPVGGIIEGPDQALHPGYYQRGEDGEFTRVDIDYSAKAPPAAPAAKPAAPAAAAASARKKKAPFNLPGAQNYPGSGTFTGG
jgi:hypothetical protein